MAKAPLTPDTEFTVGEEKVLNYIVAFLSLCVFIYGLIEAIIHRFKNLNASSVVFFLFLLLSLFFFSKAISKRIFIRINKKGIYQDEKLVTNWENFLKAFITQKEKTRIYNIQDNFQLVVEHRKEAHSTIGLRRKIPLGNTQNQSEEDIMEAIKFFLHEYKKTVAT